jgi:hypothetical protein
MYAFMKIFCKTNLLIKFSHLQTQQLKVIYDLYFQCLSQNLSKTTSINKAAFQIGVRACLWPVPESTVTKKKN